MIPVKVLTDGTINGTVLYDENGNVVKGVCRIEFYNYYTYIGSIDLYSKLNKFQLNILKKTKCICIVIRKLLLYDDPIQVHPLVINDELLCVKFMNSLIEIEVHNNV
jgi:hypothetical protein